jgi:hypothetical protein
MDGPVEYLQSIDDGLHIWAVRLRDIMLTLTKQQRFLL